jgi:hypothetical protein
MIEPLAPLALLVPIHTGSDPLLLLRLPIALQVILVLLATIWLAQVLRRVGAPRKARHTQAKTAMALRENLTKDTK